MYSWEGVTCTHYTVDHSKSPGLLLSCLHLFLACHQERVDVLKPFKLGLVNASYHFPRRREEEGKVEGGREEVAAWKGRVGRRREVSGG